MLNYKVFDMSCKNILIREVNWIGDAVMTMPAIRSLRRELPDAKISILVKPWVAPLFENNPNIDEIILYGDEYNSLIGKFRLSSILKTKGFCSSILFQNAFDAALITYFSGISQRIGYSRDWRRLFLTYAIPFDNEDRKIHHIDYYLNLLMKIGIKADYSLPYIYLSLEERLKVREKLRGLRRPIIGINAGATYGSTKRWPSERFAVVTKKIISELGGSVVIFGSESEIEIAEEVAFSVQRLAFSEKLQISNSLLNLAGQTSLRELCSLIAECDILLTNDSGPMHIGYAVRTPLVAIFGSTDPALTGPVGDGNLVIKKDIDCSPCFKRRCDKQEMVCMNAITSDEVFKAIKNLIPRHRAVFFDRDGTLCKDVGYLNKFEDLEIFKDVSDLRTLKEKGFKLIGVSNQSGIARGIVDENFVKEVNNIFVTQYGFDDFYYCPHHPDEHCPCRKPEPEMVLKARAKYNIELKKSYVVGDKELDILLAKAVCARSILVLTGQDNQSSSALGGADYIAKNLGDAVKWILNNEAGGHYD
jgi:heptosyltransferase-2